MTKINKTRFLDIWKAQTNLWNIRITASITNSKILLFAILEGKSLPNMPKEMDKANFIWFYIWENHMTYSWMMIEDKNKWTGLIDVLFYTSLRIAELLWIKKINTVAIKKPSISKKLLKWWFKPSNDNHIKWRLLSINECNVANIELLIPKDRANDKIRNTSNWDGNHTFYKVDSRKIVWIKGEEYNSNGLMPIQAKFDLETENIDLEWLLDTINWKYRLSQKQIKNMR